MNRKLVETWLAAEALMFVAAAVVHSGVLGSLMPLPRLLPAAIVEGVCAVMLLAAAFAVHRRRPSARRAAIAAHGVAIGSVCLGLLALWLGLAAHTRLELAYQRGMLGVLAAMFLLLASPLGAIAFRGRGAWGESEDWFMPSQPATVTRGS